MKTDGFWCRADSLQQAATVGVGRVQINVCTAAGQGAESQQASEGPEEEVSQDRPSCHLVPLRIRSSHEKAGVGSTG